MEHKLERAEKELTDGEAMRLEGVEKELRQRRELEVQVRLNPNPNANPNRNSRLK